MSKVAPVGLHRHLAAWEFPLRDGKWMTPHLASFGFRAMPRETFQALLDRYTNEPGRIGRWSVEPALDLADWPARANAPLPGKGPPARLRTA